MKCGALNGPYLLGDRTGFLLGETVEGRPDTGLSARPACGGEASRFPVNRRLNLCVSYHPPLMGIEASPGFAL